MCGFIGGTGKEWNYSAALESIAHRGPDESSLVRGDEVNLGFRRLSIVDLSTAAGQPMSSDAGDVSLVFNGEIYGFRRLRRALETMGARFHTHSDTEVLLHAYLEWGEQFIEHVDGMFAIVIWDARQGHLKLYRDRSGIKPLYYFFDGREFAFASELKALEAALPPASLNYDGSALYDFLGYRYVPAPKTLYRNCYKLRPAHTLEFDVRGRKILADRPYWNIESFGTQSMDGEQASEELRSLVDSATRDQLVADVPVGFFLSGGIDSSVVVATAARLGVDVRTFSLGFDIEEASELPYARMVAERFETIHIESVLTNEAALDYLPKFKTWFDEPFADESAVPTWLVSASARKKVTVVLTGDGGDEVFGGYRTYPRYERYDKWPNWPKGMENLTWRMRKNAHRRSAGSRTLELLEMGFSAGPGLWARIMSGMPTPAKLKYRAALDIPDDYEDWWHYAEHWREDLSTRTRLQYVDFKTFLPGLVLTKVDRTTMAVSLEARVPLLDRRIIEFAFSLPEEIRLPRGAPKGLLRESYRDILPDEILDRRKKGFGMPRDYLGNLGRGEPVQEFMLNSLFLSTRREPN